MMNPSPLPQPAAQTCPKCGAAADEGTQFCPRCGAALSPSTQNISVGLILTQIGLAFIALCGGLFGTCFAVFGVTNIGSAYGTFLETLMYLALAAASLGIAALCIRRMINMGRKR